MTAPSGSVKEEKRMSYKAAVLTRPETIIFEEREPKPLRPNEVRIKVAYAGICATDLSIYYGEYKVPLPLVLGHEFS